MKKSKRLGPWNLRKLAKGRTAVPVWDIKRCDKKMSHLRTAWKRSSCLTELICKSIFTNTKTREGKGLWVRPRRSTCFTRLGTEDSCI